MKILIIQNYGGLGGGSRSALDVAKVFLELKHSVDMIVDNPSEEFLTIGKKININIIENHPPIMLLTFHNASGLWIKSWFRFLKGKKNKNAWVNFFKNNNQYDLVVLNSSTLCCFCDILNNLNINNITIIRETFKKNILMNKLQFKYLKESNAIAYLTEFDKNQWNMNKNEFILPEIIDESLYDDLNETSFFDNNFLYLGGLSSCKGALTYLKAALEITKKRPDLKCSFTILGNTYKEFDKWSILKKIISFKHYNYRNKCNKVIYEIQCIDKKSLDLVGLTTDISKYYKKCMAVVFPVQEVHQPRPAYEAGLFKKPIILPDFDNFKDNVVDDVNGFYFQKKDSQSLAKVMIQIAENTKNSIFVGENNKKNTIEKHSLANAKKIMQQMLESFRKNRTMN